MKWELRRCRRQAVRRWGRVRGPGTRLVRRALLVAAAMELAWAVHGSPLADIRQIGECGRQDASGDHEKSVERTGVNVRLKDGSITIFKVNEYVEQGSD